MESHEERLAAIDDELKNASLELNLASVRYQKVIIARIALRTLINQKSN